MGYLDEDSDLTPEERRMQLLAAMGSPFLGNRSDADLSVAPVGAAGMMPQGFMAVGGNESRPELAMGAPWMDPGQTAGGSGQDYTDPPPRLGNLFRKPGEPQAPEQDGILFNGTRSDAGRGVLAAETPAAAIPAGPIASPDDVNVRGANAQDRSNAPRSPDVPQTAAPVPLPPPRPPGIGGPTPAPAGPPAVDPDRMKRDPAAAPAAAPALPQPQAAALADGLSRKPGSPSAMNWLSENADLFIALGAGLLSGKNVGEGIIQGLTLANNTKIANNKLKLEAEKNQREQMQTATVAAWLKQKNPTWSDQQAIAAAGVPSVAAAVGKQIVEPDTGPDWEPVTLQDGTKILQNKKTGDRKADPGAKVDAPARPLTADEKARWGIPSDDMRPYAIAEGKAPTLIGGQAPFESPAQAAQKAEETARTEVTTGLGKRLAEGRMDAITNRNMLAHVNELMGQVQPGAITSATNALRERFGLSLDQNAGKVQAVQAAFEKMANDMHKKGQGPMTDADREAFRKMVPTLTGDPEGNRIIMDTMRGMADYNLKASEIGTDWATRKISGQEMHARLESLPDPFANFRQYQAQRDQAAPSAAPGSAPAGAAQSPIIRFDRNGKRIQ